MRALTLPRPAPRPTDLSYFNWDSAVSASNSSPNFEVLTDGGAAGLSFKVKRDRKVIVVDPAAPPGDNTTRTEIAAAGEHLQVVLWDHFARRKA